MEEVGRDGRVGTGRAARELDARDGTGRDGTERNGTGRDGTIRNGTRRDETSILITGYTTVTGYHRHRVPP